MSYGFISLRFAKVSELPNIVVIETIQNDGLVTVQYSYPVPVIWHKDLYAFDPDHRVIDSLTGQCEKAVMEENYRKVRTILEWEQRRVSENIGTLFST